MTTTVDAAKVAAYLRAHPRFLADNPDLYRVLVPPERVHGQALADHMAAMLASERIHARAMSEQADLVLAAGRASAGLAARVHEAVLALMQCVRHGHAPSDCISSELPVLLAVDAATLCSEQPLPGARLLPRGMVQSLLGTRSVVCGADCTDPALLHGEAMLLARHEALVRLPGQGPAALLALAVRDPGMLDAAQGTAPLVFLGRAVAAALGR